MARVRASSPFRVSGPPAVRRPLVHHPPARAVFRRRVHRVAKAEPETSPVPFVLPVVVPRDSRVHEHHDADWHEP